MRSFCPIKEFKRDRSGDMIPINLLRQGSIRCPFGAPPPLVEEPEEKVAIEPIGAFDRDPTNLEIMISDRLMVNQLFHYALLSYVELKSLLDDLDRVTIRNKPTAFSESLPVVAGPKDLGARRIVDCG